MPPENPPVRHLSILWGAEVTSPDYPSVIADLRVKRAELDALISSLEHFAGADAGADEGPNGGVAVPADAFFQMNTTSAIKKFLGMSRRPHTTGEVVDALEIGGFIHKSKNLKNMVYTALTREERREAIVQLPDKTWGLSERYPNRARQPIKPADPETLSRLPGGATPVPLEEPEDDAEDSAQDITEALERSAQPG